ncbi:DUF1684 domain-containing protein [Spirosoma sp. KUDC1026]|nr:DUF1684 domain-containing protein [Spirosoma sp. KUDC1026]
MATLLALLPLLAFAIDTPYEETIRAWQKKRIESLKSEDGWLNLAGLFWLKEGINTLGSSDKNSIVFPANHSKASLGKLVLKNGTVTFEAAPDAGVSVAGQSVTKQAVFPATKPVVLEHQSLRWFVIKRGDKYAVRLRDLESPEVKSFAGIPTFPVQENWRVKAKFIPTTGEKIAIIDVTGRVSQEESPGRLVFTVDGKEQILIPTGDKEHLFVVFADETTRHETYGGGRFLDLDGPNADGYVDLDFNKAYNPPCAFTPYATCPTPPKENRLTVAIRAGEQYKGDH